MGIYLNPDNVNFRSHTKARIYVDKTMMLAVMNRFIDEDNKYICVSRPRRFGKTIAGNMLAAYYSKGCDSRELFAPFRIADDPSFEGKLNKYNVIKIDLNGEYQRAKNKGQFLDRLTEKINDELYIAFPDIQEDKEDSLGDLLLKIYGQTGETFIIIIDEYDVLIRERVSKALFDKYLSFLNGLFKDTTLRPAISLAYLTGILPVVRDRIQSKLNNFEEYTILDALELAEYIGFTSDEVKDLCAENDMDFEECARWYDGYSQRGFDIYNPQSVIKTVERKQYSNYWSKTSTYQAILDRIKQDFEGTREAVIQMLAGEAVDVNATAYMNTMDSFETKDDLLTYLIHIGYLAYDMDNETCRIPNREIRQEWYNAVRVDPEYKATDRIIRASKELLEETINGNEEAVAKALDESHINVTSNRNYNNEYALHSAIYLAYVYALNKYTIIKEMTTGKGYADVVFIPYVSDIPAMIIELKRNDSTDSAINQIKEKKYFSSLSGYEGKLLFVGINYNEKSKTHTCKIERFEK